MTVGGTPGWQIALFIVAAAALAAVFAVLLDRARAGRRQQVATSASSPAGVVTPLAGRAAASPARPARMIFLVKSVRKPLPGSGFRTPSCASVSTVRTARART